MISLIPRVAQGSNNINFKPQAVAPSKLVFGSKLQPLDADTVSFSKPSKELLSLSNDEISSIVFDSWHIDNKLGSGSEGTVYLIPNTDYCVKFYNYGSQVFSKWSQDLTEQEKLNHIVAKADNGAVIMKRIRGKSLPFNFSKPPELYELPLESYKNYVIQLINAHNANLECDAAPANVIFDEETQTLTQIDFQYQSFISSSNRGFECAFACLRNFDPQKDQELALKLFQIALDSLKVDSDDKIDPKDVCVDGVYFKLTGGQKNKFPNQYKFLTEAINATKELKLEYLKNPNEENKIKLNTKVRYAQSLINQLNRGEY